MNVVLEAKDIVKEFPGVRALNHVSFRLEKGQIHALCGENGAGKSTLINVLSGVYPRSTYEGQFFIDGEKAKFQKVHDATQKGIAVIHQELSLFDELSVMENMFVGHEITKNRILDKNKMYVEASKWLKRLKMDDISPDTRLGNLGVGKQQLVEIARVLRLADVKVLILDEPTAALTEAETEILLGILLELKKNGMSIIYISHKLDEVMRIADYVTVLRDGESVGGAEIERLNEPEIVRLMVGREINELYPERQAKRGDVVLEVRHMNVKEHFTQKSIVEDVSFTLRKGEILGVFGLIGAGRTELMSAVVGSYEYAHQGEVCLEGKDLHIKAPADAIKNGIVYCTEDRKGLGIIPTMDIRENMTLSRIHQFKRGLAVDQNREILASNQQVKAFNVKTPSLSTKITNLSGGNQQKVLLGRSMIGKTKVLILDEPTRGIDVGAKQEIYSIINRLAEEGFSIIMVSSELPEILGVCDRVLVMHRGKITGEFDNTELQLTQEEVMTKATGM